MNSWTKTTLLSIGLLGALAAGGCATRYYDDDYGHRAYYDRTDGDHRYDRDRDDHLNRVRVCDADGDDCHWEYRRN